jgi:deaminated glutathione amidase
MHPERNQHLRRDVGLKIGGSGLDANPFLSTQIMQGARKRYNTHLIVNPEGQIMGNYRKIHLFDVDLSSKGGISIQESASIKRGNKIHDPVYSPCGYLGLSISFDIRFPELYRYQVLKGAQTLLVPSQFLPVTGATHWNSLLRARAIEN